ncbi:ABC transporter ATP-binding protein [Nocardiopsis flavescens]|uniref:ABC transporter ATP-binding protein n=1 Tax=Nocardiopsis flavescens TaxID=758803 RepID=UPI00364A557A
MSAHPNPNGAPGPLLSLTGLRVVHPARRGGAETVAVADLSLRIPSGATSAIVGESGSGKSTTLNALLGLLPRTARVDYRSLEFGDGTGRLKAVADPRSLRGRGIGLIPQDPVRSLDPLVRVEGHFRELYRHFLGVRGRAAGRELAVAALESVGVDRPGHRLRQYPHELSGGLLQRVLIALALVGGPRLLLADEPTSNLDTTVQKRVLDLVDEVRAARGLSVLLVTHDIAVAAERADHLMVMRSGRVVEEGPTRAVLDSPRDPYTRELLGSVPGGLPARPSPAGSAPAPVVLEARGLCRSFGGSRGRERTDAVREVGFRLRRGRTLAVVGESGAGKSTLLRLLTGLERPDRGEVLLDGAPVGAGRRSAVAFSRRVQLVYQNPGRSLNPSLAVGRAVAEPLEAHGVGSAASRAERSRDLLERVGLPGDTAVRRPAQLSGGQLQRVAIARALALEPDVVVLDEPVSALDQAVRFALLRLLSELQEELGVAYVLVSHDLGVVRAVSDDVLVMRRGRVEEHGPTEAVFADPASPHTRALLDAVPVLRPDARPGARAATAAPSPRPGPRARPAPEPTPVRPERTFPR